MTDWNGTEIAIVGMACRVPGADTPMTFWHNIQNGVESISFFADEALQHIPSTLRNDPNYVKAKPILPNIKRFDASFFGYTPREAEMMDPQHRHFLECAWSAFEDAGYDVSRYTAPIGVFAGTSISSYLLFNIASNPDKVANSGALQTIIGNDKDYLATRIAYKLDLKGPAVSVNTACSSSMVAVHLACQSLNSFECDLALAGGAAIGVPQETGYLYQPDSILSPDGHCRPFDADAQGTIFGNGLGAVVLKRLEDALEEGDHIYAIVRGTAINNDGSQKVNFTAPSTLGQANAVAQAISTADIPADTITYIEAHGTGTTLGDPIEIEALKRAFALFTEKTGFCGIGSVKSNIGHLDAASGVIGLIKTALALKYQQLPPSLHINKPNPKLELNGSPFYLQNELQPWNASVRRAGVSSFGMGGTNSHAILEEAPIRTNSTPATGWHILPLSARSQTALDRQTEQLAQHLAQNPDSNMADVAYTLQLGRRPFTQRRVLISQNISDTVSTIEQKTRRRYLTGQTSYRDRPVTFLFTGQGAQYAGMGKGLYETYEAFQTAVDQCATLLQPHLGRDIREVMFGTDTAEELAQTALTQPALFTIEYALTQQLAEWGVQPQAMIGHSIGEYVAACVAGVFSLEEALKLVALRGKLMQEMPTGSMLSVQLSPDEVQPYLSQAVTLAAVNSSQLCVLSGADEAITAVQTQLEAQETQCRRLKTSHAFHSAMMEPMLDTFKQAVAQTTRQAPQIRFISNVSGTWITDSQATDPAYWASQIRQPVQFAMGLSELCKTTEAVLLEVGPGRTLTTFAQQHAARTPDHIILQTIRHPKEEAQDSPFLLATVGRLWLAGVTLHWENWHEGTHRHRVPLPTYPFEGVSYWIDANESLNTRPQTSAIIKEARIANWFYTPTWQRIPTPPKTDHLPTDCWLFFVKEEGVPDEWRSLATRIVTVQAGTTFSADGNHYVIDPQNANHYEQLCAKLKETNTIPQQIVHSWGHGVHPTFEAYQVAGLYSLFHLVKALAKKNITSDLQISLVVDKLVNVWGNEALQAEKAPLLGLCRVIPQEYMTMTCRVIDAHTLAEATNELQVAQTRPLLAYRSGRRWVRAYEPTALTAVSDTIPTHLRQNGVYLITGGFGQIGHLLARYLAESCQATLILVSRTTLPPRAEWETITTSSRLHTRIQQVKELEALGATVIVKTANVGDLAQLTALFEAVDNEVQTIHGVIHAAGVLNNDAFLPIQQMSLDAFATHFDAKVIGCQNLAQVLAQRTYDFCLLTSSLSTILGGFGYTAYAASNWFMDIFAEDKRNWHVLNWDAWQMNGEEDMGMSLNEIAMTGDEGLETFIRFMDIAHDYMIVSTAPLESRLEQWVYQATHMLTPADPDSFYDRPNLPNAYQPPTNEVEEKVVTIWEELLGIRPIGIEDDFFELGGHSLLATMLLSRLRQTFETDLPLAELFTEPTVVGVASHVQKAQEAQSAKMDTISDILKQIQTLSPDEVKASLEQENAP